MDSSVHYVVVHGNLLKVTGQVVVILDLAQHATAAALLVLSCPTHSLLSQKLIPVRNALLVNLPLRMMISAVNWLVKIVKQDSSASLEHKAASTMSAIMKIV